LCALVFLGAAVFAASGAAQEPLQEENFLDDIKGHMTAAAEENARLAQENETLRAQLIGLQLEVAQYEQDMEDVDPGYREVSREREPASGEWSDPESDALVQEAQNIYLSGQMLDMDAAQKLRELQLYDLQYEKQELQLDLKSAKYLSEKARKRQNPELDALEQDLKIQRAKLDEMGVKIAEQEKAALVYPQRVELLKMENAALKMKIKQLRKFLQ